MVGRLLTHINRYAFPLVILAVSLTATYVGWKHASNDEYREAKMEFTRTAQAYQILLDRRMAAEVHSLADLSVHIETGNRITYAQFVNYINSVNALRRVQRTQHLGYLSLRNFPSAPEPADGARIATTPGNQSRWAGQASFDGQFSYVYPGGDNMLPPLDVNALNKPVVRDAWQKARDQDQVIATGNLQNVLKGPGNPSFLLFAPVYQEAGPLGTIAQRRVALKGLVYEAFRADELLWATWGTDFNRLLDVRFAVESAPGQFVPLYNTMTTRSPSDQFLYTKNFYAAGREWSLRLRSPANAYMNPVEHLQPTLLFGGIFISLLLTAVGAMWGERRRTSKIQQEQNQRFRSLFDQNPDAVYSLDLNGCFSTANRQTETLSGKSADQLVHLCVRDVLAPDRREESLRRLEKALHGQPTYGETAIIKRNGERIELAVTHLPIVVDGKLVGVFGIAKDITARKQAEAALREAHAKLEDRVRDRTSALRQEIDARKQEVEARKQTEAALRELTDHLQNIREDERTRIAREIHDELGGAMAAIKFDLSAPIRQCSAYCDRILQRNQDSLRLVDNAIASLRRIIADLRPSMLDDLGLWATLDWLASDFKTRMEISVLFDLEGDEVEITPEKATAIFRIVQESLNNVAKHACASQVEILATTTESTISIVVQDNGRGFSPGTIYNDKTYGILGMHERAQAFNGTVEVNSQPGKGTTVSIEFPI